ncbi:transposase, partial [Desulfobacter latus]|nr:transposase [Desulfobacter latus]
MVYSKPPFSGPAEVVKYIGRYTHSTAISNNR